MAAAPELAVSAAESDAARRQASAERWSRLPRITGSVDVARGDHPVYVFGALLGQRRFTASDLGAFDTATGTFDVSTLNEPDPVTNVRSAVTATLTLWSGGAVGGRVRAASETARASAAWHARRRAEVRAHTETLFRRAVVAERALEVLRGSLDVATEEWTRVRRLFEEGLRVQADVDRLGAEVADMDARIAAARADSVEAKSLLAIQMGRDAPIEARLSDPPEPAARPELTPLLEASAARADVSAIESTWRAERASVATARGALLPALDVMASVEYDAEDGFDDGGSHWLVGAGVSWTLDPGAPHRVSAASARARAAEARRNRALDQARHDVRVAHARSVAAAERADAFAQAVESASEALRLVRRRHAEGLATTLELTSALDAHTRARLAFLSADQERGIARAHLRLAAGEFENQEDTHE